MNIIVVASPGLICPRENPSEPKITDSEPVSVQDTVYYRRLLSDRSLQYYTPAESTKKEKTK